MERANKFAVVTGAGKGIGKAIALLLAEHNYTVIACSRTESDLVQLAALNPNILYCTADLSTAEGVNSLILFTAQTCGTPNVIVNNAGLYKLDSVLDENARLFNELMQVNYWAGYRLSLPFTKAMVNRGAGHIVSICSLASIEAKPYASSYSISKHAQLGFSRALALDLQGTGVNVTAILPGNVNTPSWDGYTGDKSNFLQPEDIARIVLHELDNPTKTEIIVPNS